MCYYKKKKMGNPKQAIINDANIYIKLILVEQYLSLTKIPSQRSISSKGTTD